MSRHATLATHPVSNPDELALFADDWTSLGKPAADRFREACRVDALAHDGWVSPNRVREAFLAGGQIDINPRQYSALWSKACGPKTGYLVKDEHAVERIQGEGSKGNTNKTLPMRRWRGPVPPQAVA